MKPHSFGPASDDAAGNAFLLSNDPFFSDMAGGGGVHGNPETTINGPTLDVTATTNYSSDIIANVTAITFETTAASTATFAATDFGGGAIASNATITGDAHADTLIVKLGVGQLFDGSALKFSGWTASDSFEVSASSDGDTITGTSANDIIKMGAYFDSSDVINGGAGSNTLSLDGDYSSALTVFASSLQNVSKIEVSAGHSYDLAIADGVVAAGKTMTIDGLSLGAGDDLTVDTSNDTHGAYVFDLGAGDNVITLNTQADIVACSTGQNQIYSNGIMPTGDKIEGDGTTFLYLSGDYSAGYTFGSSEFTNVSVLYVEGGFSYKLETKDANVAAGKLLGVDATGLGTGDSFSFNGSHETDGGFEIYAGAGYDKLTGGSGNDFFSFSGNSMLTAADRIDGGSGNDVLTLDGDYSAGLKFESGTVVNIADIDLTAGHSYNLTTADATVAAGKTLTVDGGELDASDQLIFNGAKETNGNFIIDGGAGNDILTGGAGNDVFNGGGGADTMTAGSGTSTFTYVNPSDSFGAAYDVIVGFNASTDVFLMESGASGPTAIDTAVTTGEMTRTNFDGHLKDDIGASQLHAHDAVLFTANSGSLAGHTYLIIDENGVAGYQAGQDMVIEITGATNLSHFSLSNFT